MMAADKSEVLLIGPARPVIARGLKNFTVHSLAGAANRDAFLTSIAHVRAMAVSAPVEPIDDALLARVPKLDIIASFGVGYDHIDALAAAKRGIVVTHTPEVLTEEVADTAIGLLLCTVRELPQAERHLRAGK
jgi:lactate dehydrogenase-like 2-hydroxyacid dehydrogenase